MITELFIAGLTTYAYRKAKNFKTNKIEKEIKEKWSEMLLNSKVDGIRNKNEETFEIINVYPKDYGFLCVVTVPEGLSVDALKKARKVIEDNFSCLAEIDKDRFKDFITVKIVNEIIKFEYVPVKTMSNKLFLGFKLDNSKYMLDLNKDPHILIAGKTGTGKSFLFATILTNLIYFNSKDIEIYLLQVMKGEIDIFKNCPAVKFTSDNKTEILAVLKRIHNIIHRRSKMFAEHGIKNITQWNQHIPDKRMKRIIIGTEEISFFMDEENECFEIFTQIVKAGRSVGIHFIGITQRTTSANLGGNGELKSQLTVITAKQRTEADSKNAIDIVDAAYLGEQEFIASTNDSYVTFKVPTVDEDFRVLNKFVPEIVVPNKEKQPKEKPAISGGWHIPNEEEWKSIRDTIPEVTYIKKEEKVPVGQMKAPKKSKKNGVISLDEVRESVNA